MRNGSGTRGIFLVNSQCLGSNLQQKDTLRKSAAILVYPNQVQVTEFHLYLPTRGPILHYGMLFTSEFQLQTADIDISVNAHVHTNNKHTHTHTHTYTLQQVTLYTFFFTCRPCVSLYILLPMSIFTIFPKFASRSCRDDGDHVLVSQQWFLTAYAATRMGRIKL